MSQTVQKIKTHLETLRLRGILNALDQELTEAAKNQTPATEILERLLSIEAQGIIDRGIERRIKASKLPERKLLSDYDFDFQTGVDKAQILDLAKLDFVTRKQGLILAGFTGTGKSHLAKALLLIGCMKRYRCLYTTASDMLATLLASRADKTLPDKFKKYTLPEILLIDEVGFDRLERQDSIGASLFFKVMEARYCKASTFLTTNIGFDQLGEYLGDQTITSAMIDRLVHHAIIIKIEGPSYRAHQSKILNNSLKKARKAKG